MKILMFLISLVMSCAAIASTGSLSFTGYYLDNLNQSTSPALYLNVTQKSLISSVDVTGAVGEGYVLLPADASGNVENGYYTEGLLDVTYHVAKGWAVDVAGGLVSNTQVYHQFDDYLHASVTYNLW